MTTYNQLLRVIKDRLCHESDEESDPCLHHETCVGCPEYEAEADTCWEHDLADAAGIITDLDALGLLMPHDPELRPCRPVRVYSEEAEPCPF